MARPPIKLDHIPPEDHEGVGLVANSWAHLEGVVERLIWRLARLNDLRGAAITAHMGIKNRVDAACTLADLEFPKSKQTIRLAELKGHVTGALYGMRNEIVHSRTLHFTDKWDPQTIRPTYKARGTLKKEAKRVIPTEYKETSAAILKAASEMRELLADFFELITKKDGAPPP
jgi:hypothetical protein